MNGHGKCLLIFFCFFANFPPLKTMFAAEIQREWSKLGVGGSSEDVVTIVHVLSGTGICTHLLFTKVQICTFAHSYNLMNMVR